MNANRKILTFLVVLLLFANAITITVFWIKKEEDYRPQNDGPAKFIIQELALDQKQQIKYEALIDEHRQAVRPVIGELRQAKDNLFSLLNTPEARDEKKQLAAKAIGLSTEKLDLITLDHFTRVRAICNPIQQKKFDAIIKQVIKMMAAPELNGPGQPHRLPPFDESEPPGPALERPAHDPPRSNR